MISSPRMAMIVAGIGVCFFASTARATLIEWSNLGSGNFNVPSNWSTGTVPGSTPFGNATNDEARVSNGGTVVVDASQSVSPQFVIIAAATGSTGTFQITGGTLTTTSDIRIGNGGAAATTASAGGTGFFNQSGGTVIVGTAGNMNVGYGDTAVGTFNLSGGLFEVDGATIMAVGNRGNGTVNQTGGSVYIRGPLSGGTAGTGQINLGRNGLVAANNPGTSSGNYTLSAGDVTAFQLRYGNAIGAPTGSTNVFNLQGGLLTTGSISIINTAASNSFNFTGGTLTTNTVGMPLTNNGGTLAPASLFFGSSTAAPPLTPAGVRTSQIGTTTFTLDNSYVQSSTGVLSIEIAAPGSNDFLDIGANGNGSATLGGSIAVTLLSGFNPALGSTFDIVTADTITNSATINGQTASGLRFSPSIVTGSDSRQVLRLTVVPEPSSAALLASGAALLSVRRKRRGLSW